MSRNPGIIQDLENGQCDPDKPAKHHNHTHDQPEGHDAATRLALAVVTNDGNCIRHAVKLTGENLVERLAAGRLLGDGIGVSRARVVRRSCRLSCTRRERNRSSCGRCLDRRKQSTGIRTTDGRPKEALAVGITQRCCRVIAGGFVCDHDSIVPYPGRKPCAHDTTRPQKQGRARTNRFEPFPQSLMGD